MASNNETTTKFKVDISELKSAMQEAKRQINLANSEFKAISSSMDNWSKSSDGLKAKLTQLNSNLNSQKSVLKEYEKTLEEVKAEYGENSKEAQEWQTKLNNQKAVVNRTESEIRKFENSLTEVSEAEKIASKTGKDVNDVLDEMEKESQDAQKGVEELNGGFTVMKGALASLVADGIRVAISALKDMAGAVVEIGSGFSSSMSEVQAISGASAEELAILEKTAREFGATTVFSASESADALKYMALAGWDAQTSASALGGVLNLASASGMELAQASDMVTDYMSAFGMEAKESAYFADLLAYAQGNSNTSAQQLGEAFKNCAGVLNAGGQDVETTTALLASMANQGLKGSEAGTALTAMMRDLTAKMKDGKIAIGDTAVTVMDANGNYRDLTDILTDVSIATNGMGDAERAVALSSTFTADSIKGLNLILNEGIDKAYWFENALRGSSVSLAGFEASAEEANFPLDQMRKLFEKAGVSSEEFEDSLKRSQGDAENFIANLDELTDAGYDTDAILDALGITIDNLQGVMDNSAGTAQIMSETMNDNLAGDVKAFQSAVEELALKVYDALEPALRDIIAFVQELADQFNAWLADPANKEAIDELGEKLTAFVEGALTTVMELIKWFIANKDSVVAGLQSIGVALAVFKIAGVISSLVSAFTTLFTVIKSGTGIMTALNLVMNANPIGLIITAIGLLVAGFMYLWNTSEDFRNFWINLWENIKSVTSSIIDGIVTFFTETIPNAFNSVIEWIKSNWQGLLLLIVNPFAGAFKLLYDNCEGFRTFIQNFVEGIKTFFTEKIPEIINNIGEWFSQLPEKIAYALGFALGTIVKWAGEVWNFITVKIPEIINNIIEWFSQLPSKIWTWLVKVITNVTNWASQMREKATEAGTQFVNNLINFIKELPAKIWTWLMNTITKVTTFISNLKSKATEAGNGFTTNLISAVQDLPNKFFNIGADIVTGIWNGISSGWSWLNGKVRELADSLLQGAKDALDINSPSKEFEKQVGKWIPAGIAVGIDKNAKTALASVKNLTADMLGATSQSLATATTTGGVTGGVVNNFTQVINSPKQLSRLDIYRQSKNLLGYAGGGF